jgi:ATP-dependent Clp protease protease subunit
MQTDSELALLFDYGIDLKNRRIYILEDICDTEWEAVAKAVNVMNADEDKIHRPIEMIVCSNGGSVELMFAFYDLIRSSKSPIHSIITGTCASAAVLVAACCHKRYATENSFLMHHSSKAWSDGLSETELEGRAKITKAMSERTYQLLAKHSTMTVEWWRKGAQEDGETWLNPEEMLAAGVIDGIIASPPVPRIKKRRVPRKKKTNAKTSNSKKVS